MNNFITATIKGPDGKKHVVYGARKDDIVVELTGPRGGLRVTVGYNYEQREEIAELHLIHEDSDANEEGDPNKFPVSLGQVILDRYLPPTKAALPVEEEDTP